MTSCFSSVVGRAGLLAGVVAVLASACGGKAVIDPVGGAGGATSTTTSQGGSDVGVVSVTVSTTTSTGPGCTCTTDQDCPELDDACFEFTCDGCQCVETPLPAGEPCMQGVCDGASNCVECLGDDDCIDGACVNQTCSAITAEVVCDVICASFETCFMEPASSCLMGCVPALQDCTGPDLDQIIACDAFLEPLCDLNAVTECILAVPCADD